MPEPACLNDSFALAAELGAKLLALGLRVTTAESCTGGGVAYAITSTPGSSQWFSSAVVSYSNAAKSQFFGVSQATLEREGAVSEAVVREMAEGALRNAKADLAVAISGVAGPDGGTPVKPVGTVCFAWVREGMTPRTERKHFTGDRNQVREQSIFYALQGLIACLD